MANPEIKWISTSKELPPPKSDCLIVVNLDGKPFVTHALYKPFNEIWPSNRDGKGWCWRENKIIGRTSWTDDHHEGVYMDHEITHWANYPVIKGGDLP